MSGSESEREEEEALVVALFKGIAPSSPRPDSQEPPATKRFKAVEQQLLEAERKFLGASEVLTEGVQLQDVASRFKGHEMPSKPSPERDYVSGLVESTVHDAVHTASPVMIGHMTSSLPYYARPMSRLITTMNQNSVKTETANTVTFLERQALAELHRQMYKFDNNFYDKYAQDPSCALGVLTSGGTIANITGLWVARNRALPGVDEIGLYEAFNTSPQAKNGIVCIGSELLHYSMTKALDVLGLGISSLIKVPIDENFRAPVAAVREAAEKARREGKLIMAIIGLAGSTEAGSFDDLDGLADIAAEYGAHFHVDAAWGGPLIFSKVLSSRLKGIERADSVTMDGHKQLYVPMGCGLLFFRHPDLSKLVRKTAGYIIRTDSHDLGKFTLEGSRPANAVHLHSNLHILGVRGYELLVDRSARMTNYMAEKVRQSPQFELLVDPPQANILLYRAVPDKRYQTQSSSAEVNSQIDQLNIRLQEAQRLRGRTFVSRTTIRSPFARHEGARIVALRVVIANPLTFEDDVDRVLDDQRDILRCFAEGRDPCSSIETTTNPIELRPQNGDKDTEKSDGAKPRTSPAGLAEWKKVWSTLPPHVLRMFDYSEEKFMESIVIPKPKEVIEPDWRQVWSGLPTNVRAMFDNSEEKFLSSIIQSSEAKKNEKAEVGERPTEARAEAKNSTKATADAEETDAANKDNEDEDAVKPRNASYWSQVWSGMDPHVRALFHDSEEQFIGSLISPDLQVQDGLFKDPRYEKHLSFWGV